MIAYDADSDVLMQEQDSFKTQGGFTEIKEIISESESDFEPATIVGYYSLTGVKLIDTPKQGIYIILYSNGKAEKVLAK